MTVLPYAIIVSMIAYCLNRKLNVSDKEQDKTKKIIYLVIFILLLFCICSAAVLLEYQIHMRAIIRFATEKIMAVKTQYILGKGLFITLFLSIVTYVYNIFAAKFRTKRLLKEAEEVRFEIDKVQDDKPFWEKYHWKDVLCYVVLTTITYLITSSLFLNFVAFVVKNYIRYNV